MKQYVRMAVPRGLVVGTTAAIALSWGLFALDTDAWPGIVGPIALTALFLANLVLTARSRRVKALIVRTLQRWTINPLVRLLLGIGINPLGLAILETRGRVSGQPRRTPVGNGRTGNAFWIIAEHGARAGYVRNIQHDPWVRVRLLPEPTRPDISAPALQRDRWGGSGRIEAGGAGQRLPCGTLLANSGEVSTDPVDGVVAQGQAQRSVLGGQGSEDGRGGLGRIAGPQRNSSQSREAGETPSPAPPAPPAQRRLVCGASVRVITVATSSTVAASYPGQPGGGLTAR